MKYAQLIAVIGSILVIIGAVLKILHINPFNMNAVIFLGLVVIISGQAWTIRLLQQILAGKKS